MYRDTLDYGSLVNLVLVSYYHRRDLPSAKWFFDVREIHKSAALVNVYYDQCSTTREALKQILSYDERYLNEKLTTQILVIKSIWEKGW